MSNIRDIPENNQSEKKHVTLCSYLIALGLLVITNVIISPLALAGNLDKVVYFHIDAKTLDEALIQFGTQAREQISFPSKLTKGRVLTRKLTGRYMAKQALIDLLKGSNLGFIERGNTVEIVPRKIGHSVRKDPETDSVHQLQEKAKGIAFDRNEVKSEASTTPAKRTTVATLQQILVTGTHIAGIKPVSPIITITSDDIKDSGLPDIASVIRSLPQIFGGGTNPNAVVSGGINGGSSELNISTADLRGIGAGATLTLVNGHRVAGNNESGFVDLSAIPTSAVKRIEIETDGASAVYGADAVAGVVNVILRSTYNGEHTDAYVGDTEDGKLTQRYSQLIGRNFAHGTGNIMFGYQYQSSDKILASQRAVSNKAGSGFSLLPQTKSHALFMSSHYDESNAVTSYINGIYNHRTSADRFYFEQQDATEDQFTLDGGITLKLKNDRTVDLNATWSGDSNSAVDYVTVQKYYSKTEEQNRLLEISVAEQGQLLNLPGGRVIRSAIGFGFRRETLHSKTSSLVAGARRVTHAYAELDVPLFPSSRRRPGVERLLFTAAGRFEHYSDFGSVVVPKFAIAWSPIRQLTLSASWGRSFQPPTLFNLLVPNYVYRFPGFVFGLPSTNSQVLLVTGSNPKLTAQTALSRTGAIKWNQTSGPLRGLQAMISYYDIDFNGRINSPFTNGVVNVFDDPLYAPFVVKDPSATLQNEIVTAATESGTYFNPFNLRSNPVYVQGIEFNTADNISKQVIHGIDVNIEYQKYTTLGKFSLASSVSFERLDQQLFAGSGLQKVSGTIFNVPSTKSRTMVSWSNSAVGIRLFVNYVSDELGTSMTPNFHVPSWTTVDGQLRYAIDDWVARLSAQNMFNRRPPSIPANATNPIGIGFDPNNYSAVGRFVSLEMSVAW